jgi:hypothetical protein
MRHLDWTSDRPLEGEKLAFFGVIPVVVFACTFWLVVVGETAIFTTMMLVSIASTLLIVRRRKGTRIVIDESMFRFGLFQRISLKSIRSVAIVPRTIGSADVLEIGTASSEGGDHFNLNGVPEDVRTQILSILQYHVDKADQ